MPVETDLKTAYSLLYDAKNPGDALEVYDSVLQQSPANFVAHIYKAACLEKLYYGFKSWHSDKTLENALELLESAVEIAQRRGDRSKLALANFRLCVHFYNRKQYPAADEYFRKARELQYQDDTMPIWEANLANKMKKWKERHGPASLGDQEAGKLERSSVNESSLHRNPKNDEVSKKPTFKMDWYQTATTITISLFTSSLPRDKDSLHVYLSPGHQDLEVTYPIPSSGGEFQYTAKLLHEVDPDQIRVSILSKKIEISLAKKVKTQWKQLAKSTDPSITSKGSSPLPISDAHGNTESAKLYPTSSKKNIDWSKLEVDDDEQNQSADAFFQQLYSGADPDTRRAMMKSFVESNGTALNTNWEEVSQKKVETVPPEGSEAKKW
ncbi:LADA_0A01750g1_1 [Lachancea dasiensis]|uniref:LADA_0A01750g1_1 n=1 Tax=Lachancea dasiensis TaxID=1072105 RepID=A0A1G4IM45_9SACH|nr:LADA_0A01750g1_1 [Lachancea dasiensis]